jgi:phosphoenolpyruvate synthase/pyruvate phosphate dikinase
MTFRNLPGIEEPNMDGGHEKTDLHEFTKRAFTWEARVDEKEAIETIEKNVKEFFNNQFQDADRIVEMFNITESMDVAKEDRLLLELQTEIARLDQEVTRRYLRAQYAYYMLDDKYWDLYRKPVSGTTNDLTAAARSKTKEDRYFYFVQYSAWKQINDKLQGIKNIARQINSRQYHR